MNKFQQKPSEPRKRPRQQRSKMLMQSVREAAILLIRADGTKDLSASAIAERSGISIGSFYQYYPNAEAVLTDIYQQILIELNQKLLDRTEQSALDRELSFEELIKVSVDHTFELHKELLAVHPSFYLRFFDTFNITEILGPDGTSWEKWAANWLAELIRTKSTRRLDEDIEFVTDFLISVTSGGIRRLATDRPEALHDKRVKEQMYQLALRYLQP